MNLFDLMDRIKYNGRIKLYNFDIVMIGACSRPHMLPLHQLGVHQDADAACRAWCTHQSHAGHTTCRYTEDPELIKTKTSCEDLASHL